MKIGVMTSSFRKPFMEAIEAAATLEIKGLQIWATNITHYHPDMPLGELDPDLTTDSERRELIQKLGNQGMEISALCGDLGRGFLDRSHLKEDIAKTKRMMEMAASMNVRVLTSHIGRVPDDRDDPQYHTAAEALEEIGAYGDELGVCFATETGPESGAALADFLGKLRAQSLKANYDPANLVLRGFDPIRGVHDLQDFIVHTHAKDAINQGPEQGEVPVGEGVVPWGDYLRALRDIGYDGYLTIEREIGDNPAEDIATAAAFLKKQKDLP